MKITRVQNGKHKRTKKLDTSIKLVTLRTGKKENPTIVLQVQLLPVSLRKNARRIIDAWDGATKKDHKNLRKFFDDTFNSAEDVYDLLKKTLKVKE